MTTTLSIADALERAARELALAGVEQSRREASRLWAALGGTTPGEVWCRQDHPVEETEQEQFSRAVARRARGEPLAYVVGTAGFRTLDLAVDPRVLIPRPETEGLVEFVLRWAARADRPLTAVDVGTGSGCIALSLAVEGRFERIVATDRSGEALEVARENLRRVAPSVPIELRHGDLLRALADERFDVIVSNPPYVSAAEYRQLEAGVRAYEPRIALVGGSDGLGPTRRLLERAGGWLAPGGLLALEVDSTRADACGALAWAAGWTRPRLEPDLFGRPRYLLATRE